MLPLCYFIACMTLQQCQQYRQSIQGLFPKHAQIDVFYWTNEEGVPVGATEDFSMQSILHQTTELKHWNFVSPEAQNWLPWYHYEADQCSGYVKLDSGIIFTNPVLDYPALFEEVAGDTRANHAALANIEPTCSISYYSGLDSAAVLVDLQLMQMLLGLYQSESITLDIKFYKAGDFAKFMSAYLANGEFGVYPIDLTSCSEATTVATLGEPAEGYPFVRLAPSGDMLDVARIQGMLNDAPRALSVF
jgi:hypothetical protein